MADDETTRMRSQQHERAVREKRLAEQSEQPEDTAEHRRRAAKAQYLEEKLEERAESEREDLTRP